jgi:hypothetical protein
MGITSSFGRLEEAVQRIETMEKKDIHKERIEAVIQELRRKLAPDLLMPSLHPTVRRFKELDKKYTVTLKKTGHGEIFSDDEPLNTSNSALIRQFENAVHHIEQMERSRAPREHIELIVTDYYHRLLMGLNLQICDEMIERFRVLCRKYYVKVKLPSANF